jgi:uncharacterized protein
METVELWPLSQGEIDGKPDRFVDAAFALGPQLRNDSGDTRSDYIDRVVRGGFPVAVARTGSRRERFFDSYVADIVNRDVIQLSEIERGPQMRALIRLVAARSGQLLDGQVPGADRGPFRIFCVPCLPGEPRSRRRFARRRHTGAAVSMARVRALSVSNSG